VNRTRTFGGQPPAGRRPESRRDPPRIPLPWSGGHRRSPALRREPCGRRDHRADRL